MANKFINVEHDKFTNSTTTQMWSAYPIPRFDPPESSPDLQVYIEHFSSPNAEDLTLRLYYRDISDSEGWFFLRSGKFIININGVENIELEPHEVYAEVKAVTTWESEKCCECDYYFISQELLKKICDAKTVDFKIIGGRQVVESSVNSFIIYAQRFYNGFYDENAYVEALEEQDFEKKETEASSGSGCMVSLLMMLAALSSFVACLTLILGIV